MTKLLFKCEYCGNPFKSEKRFEKHKCKEMQREKDFLTFEGQSAWTYYKMWMKIKHKSTVSASDTFKHSSYFNTFYKFVEFTKKTNMPDIRIFITLMVKNKIDPKLWAKDGPYGRYLEYMSHQAPVGKLVEISVKTILDLADSKQLEPSELFNVLTANEIIQLLYQRKLSPWVLLQSKKFADFYINKTTKEEQTILRTIINADYWKAKFKRHPRSVETVKECIAELEL